MTSGGWRLGHRPALDGLRGIAVALVVFSHLFQDGPLHAFGPTGVVVFFTLSGFLITTLLMEERARTGATDLRRFYARRARRLLPALLACVAAASLVAPLVTGSSFMDWSLVVGALTYSANWLLLDGVGVTTVLGHTWSLAIEEQFYLVWPVLLIASSRVPRRVLLWALAVAATGSAFLPFVLWSEGWARVYYGSDTRAFPLLVGCALAVVMHGSRERQSRPVLAAVGVAVMVAATFLPFMEMLLVTPTVVALATVVVIYTAAQGPGVWWLSGGVLTLVGRRSYGLYLWHWPAIVFGVNLLGSPPWWVLAVTAVPVAWVLTLVSWRFVEEPFLRVRAQGTPAPTARPAVRVSVA